MRSSYVAGELKTRSISLNRCRYAGYRGRNLQTNELIEKSEIKH